MCIIKMILCDLCGNTFTKAYLFNRHISRKFPCFSNISTKSTDNDIESQKHVIHEAPKVEIEVKPEKKCSICTKEFKNRKDWLSHESKCTGCHILQCPTCKKMFKSASSKSNHKRNVTCIAKHDNIEYIAPVQTVVSKPIDIQKNDGSLYILVTREFINTGEPIYKVGRTKHILKRVQQYPKGSKLLFSMVCTKTLEAENEILRICRHEFIQRKDLGVEYFEGSQSEIADVVFMVVKKINNTTIHE